ncbi:MAG: CbtA family protein [Methylorubrum populi]
MVRDLLLRGMLAGIVAALLAFAFAKGVAEPYVDRALAVEETLGRAAGTAQGGEAPIVSRATQAGIGLLTGLVLYGAALGGSFALVFAFAHGRLGRIGAHGVAGLIALAGFVAIVLVPGLKYPANPPSVGDFRTIGHRTALFFWMVTFSVGAMALAVAASGWMHRRRGSCRGAWGPAVCAGLSYGVLVGVAALAMPAIDEVPEGFPAALLWDFRLAALGVQTVLWGALGLAFDALTGGRQSATARGSKGR